MKSIEWLGDAVRFIDQSRLPAAEVLVTTKDPEILVEAIRTLRLRGAPLIGISAGYGIALTALRYSGNSPEEFQQLLKASIDRFHSTRPTAVNLFWALRRMEALVDARGEVSRTRTSLIDEAIRIHHEDEMSCEKIGTNGEPLIPENASVITHCNTGFLATGGQGTALGVLGAAHRKGKQIHIFVDETRPAFQGSRLTAWECAKVGIPYTLVTDSTAASLMKSHQIDLVIVGADRIARNGDVANKIGTYALAVLAHHHSIPLYVAAPMSTVDHSIPDGSAIVIEERDPAELRSVGGIPIAPADAKAFAPAFDVTPARLISAIITDSGVFRPPLDLSGVGER
jgi:methylthioribose-1-phosphate isomerase